MGRNTGDFIGASMSARDHDSVGAPTAVQKFDGPSSTNWSGAENQFAGHTGGPAPYRGT